MRARIVSLALLASLATSGPASARPTILGSTYQESKKVETCLGDTCILRFSKIPNGKAVVFTRVSCFLSEGARVGSKAVFLSEFEANVFSIDSLQLLLTEQPATNGSRNFFANGQGPFLMFGGVKPVVRVQTDAETSIALDCTILGNIRKIPAS